MSLPCARFRRVQVYCSVVGKWNVRMTPEEIREANKRPKQNPEATQIYPNWTTAWYEAHQNNDTYTPSVFADRGLTSGSRQDQWPDRPYYASRPGEWQDWFQTASTGNHKEHCRIDPRDHLHRPRRHRLMADLKAGKDMIHGLEIPNRTQLDTETLVRRPSHQTHMKDMGQLATHMVAPSIKAQQQGALSDSLA